MNKDLKIFIHQTKHLQTYVQVVACVRITLGTQRKQWQKWNPL